MALLDPTPFSVSKVGENVYLIQEKFNVSQNICNIWLSKGSTLDVIVDTGFGLWDLPGFLKSESLIGEKPVLAVATHVHFDHVGGMHQFDNHAIHALEYEDLSEGNGIAMATYFHESDISVKPYPEFRARDFKVQPVAATRALQDGDVIDQGDRKLHVIHLPGHSKGSIALFEPENGYLFSGDVVYDNLLIDFAPGSCVDDYVHSMHRLEEMAPDIRCVFPGHSRILDNEELLNITTTYIRNATKISKCCKTCLRGMFHATFKGRNTSSKSAKCFYYGCCCFCYEKVF